jgi:putative transposase
LVYYYFRKFETTDVIEIIHDSLRDQVRVKKGKEISPSLGLVDSQSVKTASLTTEKGLDGNKKVSGRKRFILSGTPVFDDGNFDCRRQYRRAKRSGRVI